MNEGKQKKLKALKLIHKLNEFAMKNNEIK